MAERYHSAAAPARQLGLDIEHAFDYTKDVPDKTRAVPAETVLAATETLKPLLSAGRILPGLYVATGPRSLPSWFLRALSPALKLGGRILWLDAGNAFDAYGASYFARSAGWNPREILARIDLARPFNLFQLETMVCRKVPERWHGEPVVVSDPMPLFYDEDVRAAEAHRVLCAVIEGMLALPAAWIVLAPEREAPAERSGWLEELARGARGRAVLRAEGEIGRLEKTTR